MSPGVIRVTALPAGETNYLSYSNMVLRAIEIVSQRRVEHVPAHSNSDVCLVFPEMIRRLVRSNKSIWNLAKKQSLEQALRRITPAETIIAVSFENLQHPAWSDTGKLLLESGLPRLTAFPTTIDPAGIRFPYWWNYLEWPGLRTNDFPYSRYGKLYSIEKLLSPLPAPASDRLERACWVGSSVGPIRQPILNSISNTYGLDIYGAAGRSFAGPKSAILKRYRYAVGAENSFGFGYDTEKIPEIWDSGCIPVGTFVQPLSDFNPAALDASRPERAFREPLLLRAPDLDPIFDYLHAALS